MPKGASVLLQDFCRIIQGGRLGLSGHDFIPEGFPAYGAGGVNGYLASHEFDEPAVVLSAIGARCGKCFFADGKWISLANTQLIFPDPARADCKFLWHQLNDERRWHRSGTGQPFIKPSDVKAHRVFLPPLLEQRRIAEILDKADALRAKRRTTLAQLDTLIQSIFFEMFGDPVTNPRGFPIVQMGEVCDVRDGTHDSPKYISDGGYPLVTSKNVTGGVVDLSDVNYISEADYIQINKRSKVDRGDIILPMIGTIGSPVIVDHEPSYAIKNVALIKFVKTSPSAVFVHHLLGGQYFDQIISRKNRGGTQKFVSLGDLRAFPLPLPSNSEQQEFAHRVESVEKTRAFCRTSEADLNALFASLKHCAFQGEL